MPCILERIRFLEGNKLQNPVQQKLLLEVEKVKFPSPLMELHNVNGATGLKLDKLDHIPCGSTLAFNLVVSRVIF